MKPIYIVSAVRTPIGDFGGALKDVSPSDLGRLVIEEATRRSGFAPDVVQQVVMGQVIASEPGDAYLARVAAVKAGLSIAAPALTLNRLCGSGLQAVISAAQGIALGEYDVAIGGGAESMSRSPHVITAARWGQRMGEAKVLDAMLEVLKDPFHACHMGVTAENVADLHHVTREEQDEAAAESHRRAARAIVERRFAEQIVPVDVKSRKGTVRFDTDEHVRGDVNTAELAALKPAFRKDGTVTAGNASGLNDGAAAVVICSETALASRRPLARILAWGHAGVEPHLMGLGPVEAVPIALRRSGLSLDQMDVIESNEAFAAQACAVAKLLRLDAEKTNPNGSGISLGHPIGATGAILITKAVYELQRVNGRYGLITMCIGGGQGIAMVVERI